MKDIIKVLLLLLVAVIGLFSCNRYEDDVVPLRMAGQVILNPDTYTTPKNQAVRLNVLANDSVGADGTLTFGLPAHGAVLADSAGFRYQPNQNYLGPDRFFYKYCSGAGCDSALVTIQVIDTTIACPIKANRDLATVLSGKQEAIVVLANDNTCGAVTVNITTAPTHGTATVLPANNLSYTSTAGYVGKDSLTYEFLTIDGRRTSANVLITVGANCTLTAVNDNAHTNTNRTIFINPLANDILCNVQTSQITLTVNNRANAKGFASVEPGNQVKYLPLINAVGRDTVEYQICSGGKCSVGYIFVNIQNAPGTVNCQTNAAANPDSVYFAANSAQSTFMVDFLKNDVYCPGSIQQAVITSNGIYGSAILSSLNGVWYAVYTKGTPPASPVYSDEFWYEITMQVNGAIIKRSAKISIHFQ